MGWLFGIWGKFSNTDIEKSKKIHSPPLYTVKKSKLYITAGGLPETCLSNISPEESNSEKGWIACGVGIQLAENTPFLMKQGDWGKILAPEKFDVYKLNGHFIIAKWAGETLYLYTDQLGLKNIYLYQEDNYVAFSSRLDWLARFHQSLEMDWEAFGSRWQMINQFSNTSILKKTSRLSQAGSAMLTPESITIENTPWSPDQAQTLEGGDFESALRNFTLCTLMKGKKRSLALSGGLDSRVLLAILMNSPEKDGCLHSFSHPDHPDRIIAERISKDLKLEHTLIDNVLPSVDDSLKKLRDYIGQTMLAAPASGLLNLQFYTRLHQEQKVVIDGGSGEIARRRYLNMLLLRGKKALLQGNIKGIHPFLRVHRANIFTEDTQRMFSAGIERQLIKLFETLPPVEAIGVENWLDLFAIRTRFPNFAGPEQSRSDSELVNYMPFIQPSFLKIMFETPLKERRNGNIFRKIIHNHFPRLKAYPLVKDSIIYPYHFSTIPASVWTKVKRKFGYVYIDTSQLQFLNSLKSYIMDTVHSTNVKNFECYEYSRLLNLANDFYNGNEAVANELDWWLAFETWRQVVYENES